MCITSIALDPEYYAPAEVAYAIHITMAGIYNKKIDKHFKALSFKNPILSNTMVSGFALIDQDYGNIVFEIVYSPFG